MKTKTQTGKQMKNIFHFHFHLFITQWTFIYSFDSMHFIHLFVFNKTVCSLNVDESLSETNLTNGCLFGG